MKHVTLAALATMMLAAASCTLPAPPTASPTAPSGTPAPTASDSASASGTPAASTPGATATPTPATMTVTLYFGNTILDPAVDCSRVFAVHRVVPTSPDVPTATLRELLAGPTAAEAAQGFTSWFSPATANALLGAKVQGNTTYVNLTDLRQVIPNASTSCGSATLLAQLGTTAQQAGMTPRVLYAINGQPTVFWEWLQMGCDATNDQCDPAPFQ